MPFGAAAYCPTKPSASSGPYHAAATNSTSPTARAALLNTVPVCPHDPIIASFIDSAPLGLARGRAIVYRSAPECGALCRKPPPPQNPRSRQFRRPRHIKPRPTSPVIRATSPPPWAVGAIICALLGVPAMPNDGLKLRMACAIIHIWSHPRPSEMPVAPAGQVEGRIASGVVGTPDLWDGGTGVY